MKRLAQGYVDNMIKPEDGKKEHSEKASPADAVNCCFRIAQGIALCCSHYKINSTGSFRCNGGAAAGAGQSPGQLCYYELSNYNSSFQDTSALQCLFSDRNNLTNDAK